jgi:hypothetical protein
MLRPGAIPGYITGHRWEPAMGTSSQTRAVENYRRRLKKRGMSRFEVLGLDSDRDLIRAFARRLAENDQAAAQIRASVREQVNGGSRKRGAIYEALRRWPIADLNLKRPVLTGRKIDL